MIIKRLALLLPVVLLMVFNQEPASADVRIKDVTVLRGMRAHQLVGYGLVSGLKGSGDTLRNSPFTELSMRSMLERMGVSIEGTSPRTRNLAAVIVTAELPPFAVRGMRIDVNISSLGDATSLAGGTLILTPLYGPDRNVYAVAQGSLLVSGFEAKGSSESLTLGVPTGGRISSGAIVERDAPNLIAFDRSGQGNPDWKSSVSFSGHRDNYLHLDLRNPDFETAVRIAQAINVALATPGEPRASTIEGPGSVTVRVMRGEPIPELLAKIGNIAIQPDVPARIVVDERTGTIVMGQDVRVSRVAVAHGNLIVRVSETPQVSQPLPFSDGETVVTSETAVSAGQQEGHLAIVDGVDLETLVTGLNRLGLKPPGIIAILQAIKAAGALQAELVVQ